MKPRNTKQNITKRTHKSKTNSVDVISKTKKSSELLSRKQTKKRVSLQDGGAVNLRKLRAQMSAFRKTSAIELDKMTVRKDTLSDLIITIQDKILKMKLHFDSEIGQNIIKILDNVSNTSLNDGRSEKVKNEKELLQTRYKLFSQIFGYGRPFESKMKFKILPTNIKRGIKPRDVLDLDKCGTNVGKYPVINNKKKIFLNVLTGFLPTIGVLGVDGITNLYNNIRQKKPASVECWVQLFRFLDADLSYKLKKYQNDYARLQRITDTISRFINQSTDLKTTIEKRLTDVQKEGRGGLFTERRAARIRQSLAKLEKQETALKTFNAEVGKMNKALVEQNINITKMREEYNEVYYFDNIELIGEYKFKTNYTFERFLSGDAKKSIKDKGSDKQMKGFLIQELSNLSNNFKTHLADWRNHFVKFYNGKGADPTDLKAIMDMTQLDKIGLVDYNDPVKSLQSYEALDQALLQIMANYAIDDSDDLARYDLGAITAGSSKNMLMGRRVGYDSSVGNDLKDEDKEFHHLVDYNDYGSGVVDDTSKQQNKRTWKLPKYVQKIADYDKKIKNKFPNIDKIREIYNGDYNGTLLHNDFLPYIKTAILHTDYIIKQEDILPGTYAYYKYLYERLLKEYQYIQEDLYDNIDRKYNKLIFNFIDDKNDANSNFDMIKYYILKKDIYQKLANIQLGLYMAHVSYIYLYFNSFIKDHTCSGSDIITNEYINKPTAICGDDGRKPEDFILGGGGFSHIVGYSDKIQQFRDKNKTMMKASNQKLSEKIKQYKKEEKEGKREDEASAAQGGIPQQQQADAAARSASFGEATNNLTGNTPYFGDRGNTFTSGRRLSTSSTYSNQSAANVAAAATTTVVPSSTAAAAQAVPATNPAQALAARPLPAAPVPATTVVAGKSNTNEGAYELSLPPVVGATAAQAAAATLGTAGAPPPLPPLPPAAVSRQGNPAAGNSAAGAQTAVPAKPAAKALIPKRKAPPVPVPAAGNSVAGKGKAAAAAPVAKNIKDLTDKNFNSGESNTNVKANSSTGAAAKAAQAAAAVQAGATVVGAKKNIKNTTTNSTRTNEPGNNNNNPNEPLKTNSIYGNPSLTSASNEQKYNNSKFVSDSNLSGSNTAFVQTEQQGNESNYDTVLGIGNPSPYNSTETYAKGTGPHLTPNVSLTPNILYQRTNQSRDHIYADPYEVPPPNSREQ